MSTETIFKHLRLNGAWEAARAALREQEAIHALARSKGVAVTDAELQAAVDGWRKARRLHKASAAQAWMTEAGVDLVDVERVLETDLLRTKLRKTFGKPEVEALFQKRKSDHERARVHMIAVDSEPLAKELFQQIHEEGEDFSALAVKHSTHPSAGRGGALGWANRKKLAPAVATAVFDAEPGAVLSLKAGGKHLIVRVDERKAAKLDGKVEAKLRKSLLHQAIASTSKSAGASKSAT